MRKLSYPRNGANMNRSEETGDRDEKPGVGHPCCPRPQSERRVLAAASEGPHWDPPITPPPRSAAALKITTSGVHRAHHQLLLSAAPPTSERQKGKEQGCPAARPLGSEEEGRRDTPSGRAEETAVRSCLNP